MKKFDKEAHALIEEIVYSFIWIVFFLGLMLIVAIISKGNYYMVALFGFAINQTRLQILVYHLNTEFHEIIMGL